MSQTKLEQSFATFMETNTKTEQVVVCPICLDNISGSKNIVITECGHSFHCNCLMTNVSHNGFKCPYCRTKMCEANESSDDDDESSDDSESSETDSVYTEIHEDDMLRGLRLFNNIINGEEHSAEDISEERFYEAYLEMVEQNNNGDNDDESTIWEDTDDEGNDYEADDTILVNRYQEQCYGGSIFHNPEYLDEEEEENEIIESNMLRGYRLFNNLINGDEHDESDINLESYYNVNM